ncbi:MAG: hypothetical protein AAF125_16845, partial [Chloroflexota bacterium]
MIRCAGGRTRDEVIWQVGKLRRIFGIVLFGVSVAVGIALATGRNSAAPVFVGLGGWEETRGVFVRGLVLYDNHSARTWHVGSDMVEGAYLSSSPDGQQLIYAGFNPAISSSFVVTATSPVMVLKGPCD